MKIVKWLNTTPNSLSYVFCHNVSSVQLLSRVQLFATQWIAACQVSCPSPTPGVHSDLCPLSRWCHPTISSSVAPFSRLQPFPPSESFQMSQLFACIRWPKYWSFSFNVSPSNEHPGLISFRMDCLDLLAVQGSLKSLLQNHSSKASILSAKLASQSNSHIHTRPLEKP